MNPSINVSCTCVRVPVYRAHSISINAEFEVPVNVPDARTALENFDGIELWDMPKSLRYPMPINYTEKEVCGVGRLRLDHGFTNGLGFMGCWGSTLERCCVKCRANCRRVGSKKMLKEYLGIKSAHLVLWIQ